MNANVAAAAETTYLTTEAARALRSASLFGAAHRVETGDIRYAIGMARELAQHSAGLGDARETVAREALRRTEKLAMHVGSVKVRRAYAVTA